MGDEQGHTGCTIGGQFAAGVEAKPAHPEHGGTGEAHREVVGQGCCREKVFALTYNQGSYQGGHTRGDMHHGATGKIDQTHLAEPATTPDPISDREVDKQCPQNAENQHR